MLKQMQDRRQRRRLAGAGAASEQQKLVLCRRFDGGALLRAIDHPRLLLHLLQQALARALVRLTRCV